MKELLKLEDNIILTQKNLNKYVEAEILQALITEYTNSKAYITGDHYFRRIQRWERELERIKKKLQGKDYIEPIGVVGPQFLLTKILK